MKKFILLIIFTFCSLNGLAIRLDVDSVYADLNSADVSKFSGPLQWRVGAEIAPSYPLPTNEFLQGKNVYCEKVNAMLTGTLRGDFSFNPRSDAGMLYHGLYQGIGVDMHTFFRNRLVGNPVSVYVLQGAPFKHFSRRLWIGYEWRFGCAFGWSDRSRDYYDYEMYPAISTRITAHMGVSIKFTYAINSNWQLFFGADATHFSNGNTSFPNAGINTIGLSVGASYIINPYKQIYQPSEELIETANRKRWIWEILAYGAWRKRQVIIEDTGPLLPGSFGVAGIQASFLRKFNRFFDAGLALDLKYDGSAGKEEYWLGGYYEEMKFGRVPFFKKCSAGLGAVAEFTMPIFTVGAGLGADVIAPKGDKRFYQLLYIKTFLTKHIFINVGYRLADFKEPQNLMLGAGYRF